MWGSYPILELLLKYHREGFHVGSTGMKLVRNKGEALLLGGFSRDRDCNSSGVQDVRAVISGRRASVGSQRTHHVGKNLDGEV